MATTSELLTNLKGDIKSTYTAISYVAGKLGKTYSAPAELNADNISGAILQLVGEKSAQDWINDTSTPLEVGSKIVIGTKTHVVLDLNYSGTSGTNGILTAYSDELPYCSQYATSTNDYDTSKVKAAYDSTLTSDSHYTSLKNNGFMQSMTFKDTAYTQGSITTVAQTISDVYLFPLNMKEFINYATLIRTYVTLRTYTRLWTRDKITDTTYAVAMVDVTSPLKTQVTNPAGSDRQILISMNLSKATPLIYDNSTGCFKYTG